MNILSKTKLRILSQPDYLTSLSANFFIVTCFTHITCSLKAKNDVVSFVTSLSVLRRWRDWSSMFTAIKRNPHGKESLFVWDFFLSPWACKLKKITSVTSVGPTKRQNVIFVRRDKGKYEVWSKREMQPQVLEWAAYTLTLSTDHSMAKIRWVH